MGLGWATGWEGWLASWSQLPGLVCPMRLESAVVASWALHWQVGSGAGLA